MINDRDLKTSGNIRLAKYHMVKAHETCDRKYIYEIEDIIEHLDMLLGEVEGKVNGCK